MVENPYEHREVSAIGDTVPRRIIAPELTGWVASFVTCGMIGAVGMSLTGFVTGFAIAFCLGVFTFPIVGFFCRRRGVSCVLCGCGIAAVCSTWTVSGIFRDFIPVSAELCSVIGSAIVVLVVWSAPATRSRRLHSFPR
jgi:hypothetical protein